MQCLHPIVLSNKVVPCGKCLPCLKNRQRDWYVRLEQELLVSKSAFFITLTYDDSCLNFVDGIPVVSRRDCQTFFKRLRKRIEPEKIRYFLCSEYGPHTFRPHYHLIIFNLPNNLINNELQQFLSKVWQKGFVTVASVTSARINYLAKYVVTGYVLPAFYSDKSRRPFSLQSRHPGIGANYLCPRNIERHKSLLQTTLPVQGSKKRLPRYYRDRIFDDSEKQRISELSQCFLRESIYLYQERNFNDDPLDFRQFERVEQSYNKQMIKKIKQSGKL